jgi:hypothetical protein
MSRRELLLLLGGAMTAVRAVRADQKQIPVIDPSVWVDHSRAGNGPERGASASSSAWM